MLIIGAGRIINGACSPSRCTLRAAILQANQNKGAKDTITFAPGSCTTIDLQGGTAPHPRPDHHRWQVQVELDGSSADAWPGQIPNGLSLQAGSGGSEIRGLIINDFQGSGIRIDKSDENKIQGNYIGTDRQGLNAESNRLDGIRLIDGAGNVIGGTTAGQGNVISGNARQGVLIVGPQAKKNKVQGNLIGVASNGMDQVANSLDGVQVFLGSENEIGGTAKDARNIISGNDRNGVLITGFGANFNKVHGNLIGVDISGGDLGNFEEGVDIYQGAFNTIGGTVKEARNVISGNEGSGVLIAADASSNIVIGNFIGTDIGGIEADTERLPWRRNRGFQWKRHRRFDRCRAESDLG